jgi:hypothetical protein
MRGAYTGPKSYLHLNREGIDGVTGVDAADGTQECIKAVRRQIGAGADWIKVIVTFCHNQAKALIRNISPVSILIATILQIYAGM